MQFFGSGLDPDSVMSVHPDQIRVQEGKSYPQNRKKLRNFMS
jgi:hypothetical protein